MATFPSLLHVRSHYACNPSTRLPTLHRLALWVCAMATSLYSLKKVRHGYVYQVNSTFVNMLAWKSASV
jgi:hypothetical protein